MVTLGVALVLRELANQFDWLTGGAHGLQGIVMAPVLGLLDFDDARPEYLERSQSGHDVRRAIGITERDRLRFDDRQ